MVNHHHDVPFRVLNRVSTFTAPPSLPANSTDNRIIHGDKLEALKSLLPEFEGPVKCIYIDPPYNTGNEGWVYNDAVNDPKMKRWLGQVVSKEGDREDSNGTCRIRCNPWWASSCASESSSRRKRRTPPCAIPHSFKRLQPIHREEMFIQAKLLLASTSVRKRSMARVQSTRFVFQPVMLVRPAQVVAFRITEAIRAGDVRIGEKLPSEQGLSQQLGISRPTLREAIKLLVQAGIVEVRPGSSGGIFIISETIPAELCGYPMPEFPLQDMDNVLEARRLFEPHVARLAAMYATSADFERMREAVQLSEQTSSRFRNKRLTDEGARLMTLASTRFNIAVARSTQNVMVVQMMEVMLRHVEMVRMLAIRELTDVSRSTQSLRSSLLAIESGEPHQIDAATAERIGLLESAWELAVGKRLRRRPVLQAPPLVVGIEATRSENESALSSENPLDSKKAEF